LKMLPSTTNGREGKREGKEKGEVYYIFHFHRLPFKSVGMVRMEKGGKKGGKRKRKGKKIRPSSPSASCHLILEGFLPSGSLNRGRKKGEKKKEKRKRGRVASSPSA